MAEYKTSKESILDNIRLTEKIIQFVIDDEDHFIDINKILALKNAVDILENRYYSKEISKYFQKISRRFPED